jgi:hypothetical protein
MSRKAANKNQSSRQVKSSGSKKRRRQRSPSDAGSDRATVRTHGTRRRAEVEEVDNDPESSEVEDIELDNDVENVSSISRRDHLRLTFIVG